MPLRLCAPGGRSQTVRKDRRAPALSLVPLEPRDVPAPLLTPGVGGAPNGDSDLLFGTDVAGRFVLFASKASNLVAGVTDANNDYDLFHRDLVAGVTQLVTRNPTTNAATGLPGTSDAKGATLLLDRNSAQISGDGRFVVFESKTAAGDVLGSTAADQPTAAGTFDVFRWDAKAGTTQLVSRLPGVPAPGGVAAAGSVVGTDSGFPAVNFDGRYVVFISDVLASQFVPAVIQDAPDSFDLFRVDMTNGAVELVTQTNATPVTTVGFFDDATVNLRRRSLSDDGHVVVFSTFAAAGSVVGGGVADRTDTGDVFIRDMRIAPTAGGVRLVTQARDGNAIGAVQNQFGTFSVISRDGKSVLFLSNALGGGVASRELLPAGFDFKDSNGTKLGDLYVRQNPFGAGVTKLVSGVNGSATVGADGSTELQLGGVFAYDLTANGTFAVFTSEASNLVNAVDRNGKGADVFVREIATQATTVASVDASGATGSKESRGHHVSDDGRFVLFLSAAPDLATGVADANNGFDAFLRDRLRNRTTVLSTIAGGKTTANAGVAQAATMAAGKLSVVFVSRSTDLTLPALSDVRANLFAPAPGTLDVSLKEMLVSGPADGAADRFRLDDAGKAIAVDSFTPFAGFAGAVRTGVGDVDGDGVADFVYGAGPGGGSLVRVISGATGKDLLNDVTFSAYESGFTGGVFVAVGDVNGDGAAEIVTTPDVGGGARVRVFGVQNGALVSLADFFGIQGDANFRGGARVAMGDVNGDGSLDAVVGAGFLGGPRIAIFDGRDLGQVTSDPRKLTSDFFAFTGPDVVSLRNGVFVAVGDLDGDRAADLVFAGGPGGGPRVFALSGAEVIAGRVTDEQNSPIANFFAFAAEQRGGVRVSVKDVDGDEFLDLAVASGEGFASEVRTYLGSVLRAGTGDPAVNQSFDPFGVVSPNGVFVG